MKRGTIVLVKFPVTDLSSSKRRPAVVISAKNSKENDFVVAFITSVITSDLLETDLLYTTPFNDFGKPGLHTTSVIKLNKLATINTSVCSGEIGYFGKETMSKINLKLKIALDLI